MTLFRALTEERQKVLHIHGGDEWHKMMKKFHDRT